MIWYEKNLSPLRDHRAVNIFLTVLIGGVLQPDYSHLYNTISELTVTNAPNIVLMDTMFSIYNILLFIFALGAYLDSSIDHRKKYRAATFNGTVHIILVGMVSLLTIISILLVGLSLKRYEKRGFFVLYTYISVVVVLISGALTTVTVGSNSLYGGLFERITIGTFLLWVMIFSYVLLKY